MQRALFTIASILALSNCNDAAAQTPNPAASHGPGASLPARPVPPTPPPAGQSNVKADPLQPEVDRINSASFQEDVAPDQRAGNKPKSSEPDPVIIRIEALLARERFSPGVADSQSGTNLAHAIAAFQGAHNLHVSQKTDAATWRILSSDPGASQPIARIYTITPADLAGPFADDVGEDIVKLAALPNGPQFTSLLEALAERFHMSEALLKTLNPTIDFKSAGERIVVLDDAPPAFAKGDVATVDISKSNASALAYDKSHKLIAFYPATVGSSERPSPSGTHEVVGVAQNPTYTYDPTKLHWGPRSAGKLVVKPGPNNPVGIVWIDLNAPSYGIHGTPDPDKIGKTASHGCVRLTNWDAEALSLGVKPGVVVAFAGSRSRQLRHAARS